LGHNLKGTGAAYGFAEITEIGAAIEAAAKQADRDVIAERAAALARYLAGIVVEYR
jgi:hypothetical protein